MQGGATTIVFGINPVKLLSIEKQSADFLIALRNRDMKDCVPTMITGVDLCKPLVSDEQATDAAVALPHSVMQGSGRCCPSRSPP